MSNVGFSKFQLPSYGEIVGGNDAKILGFSNIQLPNTQNGPTGAPVGYTTLPVAYIKGEAGKNFDPDAVGPLASRSDYDAEAVGFAFVDTDAGTLYFRVEPTGWSDPIPFGKGDPGDNGWSPVFANAIDGERRVLKVVNWTGGAGTKPGINVYVGPAGFVSDIADAVDVRGNQGQPGTDGTDGTDGMDGVDGDKGWSLVPALVIDGARRVLQVADWTGGAGTKPATGDYIGATGLTALLADAVDIRGAAGTGTGDMEKADYDTDNDGIVDHAELADTAPWAGITDKPATFPPETHTHADATDSVDGFMSAADKTKLDGVAAEATKNATDAELRDRATHTGTQSADTLTDGTVNKAYTATERTKLGGIANGATANATDAALRDRNTHTGTQSADTITDGAVNKAYTAAEKTKLAGVAAGATANATDAQLRDRSTHTGQQPLSTISDAGTAASKDVGTAAGQVPVLDGSGLIPSALLPSFVDDVLEYANLAAFPATGTSGKIFVTLDTNKTYRWGGSAYTEISASPGSTDAVTEGSTNLYFTAARVLSTVLSGLSTATNAAITAADTVLSALGKLQKQITDLTTTVGGKLDATAQAADSAKLGGAAAATANTASTIAQRDSSGDITTRLFKSTYPNGADSVTAFIGRISSDGTGDTFLRPQSIAQTKALLGVGTMASRSVTISAAAPSGGADGDVWFQI